MLVLLLRAAIHSRPGAGLFHLITCNGKWGEESDEEEGDHFEGNAGFRGFRASEFEWQSVSDGVFDVDRFDLLLMQPIQGGGELVRATNDLIIISSGLIFHQGRKVLGEHLGWLVSVSLSRCRLTF